MVVREGKRLRGFVILGLCGSFAVVPAISLLSGGNGSARRLPGPAQNPAEAGEASLSSGSVGVAALIASDLGWSFPPLGPLGPLDSLGPLNSGGVDGVATPQSRASLAQGTASESPRSVPGPAHQAGSTGSTPASPLGGPAVPAVVASASPPVIRAVPAPGSGAAEHGVASWLSIAAGTCADNAAPMGATLTVTNAAGVSITCKVVSRGPFVTGRVVDLAESSFSRLGSLSRGLVSVTVTW